MEHYVGVTDVSLKLTAICMVDRTGKIEREGVVASDPETISRIHQSASAECHKDRASDGSDVQPWLSTD